jgi:hypothetical protein
MDVERLPLRTIGVAAYHRVFRSVDYLLAAPPARIIVNSSENHVVKMRG